MPNFTELQGGEGGKDQGKERTDGRPYRYGRGACTVAHVEQQRALLGGDHARDSARYKGARDACWFVRQRAGSRYLKQRIGTTDDHIKADGAVVLSHAQAVKLAVNAQLAERRVEAPRHFGDGLTLNEVFDKYVEDRQLTPDGRFGRVMPDSTATNIRGSWTRYAREDIGTKLVTALTTKSLRDWHAGIVRMPPTKRGKVMPFDPTDADELRSRRATANKQLTSVKAALNWARKNELLPDTLPDIWRNVPPFNLGDEGEPRMWDQAEIARVLKEAAPDLGDLIAGALMTRGRLGELRNMKVGDYYSATSIARLVQTKTYKILLQPLTREGAALFDRLTKGRAPHELMFVRADQRPWEKSDVAKPMRATLAAAKVEDASFKTTRATYGKLLLLATGDIEMVAKALGHADSRITRRHYARYLPKEIAAAVAKLPNLGIPNTATRAE